MIRNTDAGWILKADANGHKPRQSVQWIGHMVLGAVLALSYEVEAHVTSNLSCSNCHSTSRNAMDLTGFQRILDLGAGDGALKVFTAKPGQTISMGVNVISGANQFGVNFHVTNPAGITNATDQLVFTPDVNWTKRSSGGTFYTVGPSSWASAVVKTFNLTVSATTPPDLYRGRNYYSRACFIQMERNREVLYRSSKEYSATTSAPQFSVFNKRFSCQVSTALWSNILLGEEPLAYSTGLDYSEPSQRRWCHNFTLTETNPAGNLAFYRVRVE